VTVFERDKNFGNLSFVKLKTAITFAPGVRMTIIIYAFGVEKNFPYFYGWGLPNSKNQPFTKFFFFFFKYYCPIFLNFS